MISTYSPDGLRESFRYQFRTLVRQWAKDHGQIRRGKRREVAFHANEYTCFEYVEVLRLRATCRGDFALMAWSEIAPFGIRILIDDSLDDGVIELRRRWEGTAHLKELGVDCAGNVSDKPDGWI